VPEQPLDVVDRTGDEVVDGNHLVAAIEQRLAEVRAEEAGPAGDDDASHQLRPMPRYSKPRRSSPARSRRFRASRKLRAGMASATLSRSSQRNSSPSVRTASTSAPSTAA